MQMHLYQSTLPLRPGLVASVLVHFALLVWLATMLAIRAPVVVRVPEPPPLTLVPLPPPPPHHDEPKQPLFKPEKLPEIAAVHTIVPPIPLPPQEKTFTRPPQKPEVVTQPMAVSHEPRVLKRLNPTYPQRAIDQDREGSVEIAGTVAPDGSFNDGRIVEETPQGYGFATALLKVIPQWRFEPKTVDGKAVPYRISYRFRFALKS